MLNERLYKRVDNLSLRTQEGRPYRSTLYKDLSTTIWPTFRNQGKMASSTAEQDLQSLSSYFNNITFTQHLSIDLLSATLDVINGDLRGDDLRTVLADKIPCEAFVLQEVI